MHSTTLIPALCYILLIPGPVSLTMARVHSFAIPTIDSTSDKSDSSRSVQFFDQQPDASAEYKPPSTSLDTTSVHSYPVANYQGIESETQPENSSLEPYATSALSPPVKTAIAGFVLLLLVVLIQTMFYFIPLYSLLSAAMPWISLDVLIQDLAATASGGVFNRMAGWALNATTHKT